MSNGPKLPSLDSYLKSLCEQSDLPFSQLARAIGTTPDLLSASLRRDKDTPARLIWELSDFLQVKVDDLVDRRVDLQSFRTIHKPRPLPEKYTVGAGSRLRTISPVFAFIRNRWGENARRSAMREVGVSESHLADPENLVHMRMMFDLLGFLKRRGATDADFIEAGNWVCSLPENQQLSAMIRNSCRSYGDLYEFMYTEISPRFDLNFQFDIVRKTSNSFRIRMTPRPELRESFHGDHVDSPAAWYLGAGFNEAFPRILGLPDATAHCLSNTTYGTYGCVNELTWA